MLSVSDNTPHPPCPQQFNLSAYVLGKAEENPEKTALSIVSDNGQQDMSFAELSQKVRATGQGLLNQGLNKGDLVLMRLSNTVDFPIAFLGAIAAGLVPVPTSAQLTAAETQKMIEDLAPKLVIKADDVACAPHDRTISQQELRTMWTGPACAYDLDDPNRLAYVVYTSGTSGVPRPVAHAHRAIWARQMMLRDWYGMQASDRMMHAGAFNWTFTLGTGLMDPWAVGATAVIPAPNTTPENLPQIIKDQNVSIFAAVPGIYRKILKQNPTLDLPDLRHALSAGEKLSPAIRSAWETASTTPIYEAFGMSECSTFICHGPARDTTADSLGAPQTGRRIAIVDDSGVVPRGASGTIAIHRTDPGLMREYLNAPEATKARFQGEWFLTGDHGKMDENGSIHYLGRSDDMMNAGGFRVSPQEVETALSRCEGVGQIAVTSVSIKEDVSIIAAFYIGSPELDAEMLSDFAKTCLAEYKRPKLYQRVDVLPTNPNGKLNRRALADNFKG
ncbi:AMP-binding protein [Epibacterium sp. SM1969]|uniref:AMP-binding protein n=1 Tax=Tritonibacter aquimaris TaxID=2663379 RepID=A0A844AJY2_9RHOB|nr:class I adenylate-forming enzyme family protein [Tritonibacter aquimaris]MQY41405.1 AMP-binding protein [Tritonibacter aquimaris]